MTSSTEQSTPVTIYLPLCHVNTQVPISAQPLIYLCVLTLIVTMESRHYHAYIRRSCQQRNQSLRMGCVLPCSWEMFQYIAGMCVVVYWFSTWQDLETPWRQISRYVCEGLCGKDLPLMNKYFRGPITEQGVQGTSRSDGRREGEKRDFQLLGWRERLG